MDSRWRAESAASFGASRREYHREWRSINRAHVNARKREYRQDPAHRLENSLRVGLWRALKGRRRLGHLEDYVGCSIGQLVEHLEAQFQPGMSWENYGEWEVDHRIAL